MKMKNIDDGWKLLFLYLLMIAMYLLMSGCSTLKKTSAKNVNSGDTISVTKYDSSAYYKLIEEIAKSNSRVTEYQPGRDTIIFVEGKPQIIQSPPQVVRIIETATESKKTDDERSINVNWADSMRAVISELSEKETREKRVLQWWVYVIAALVVYIAIKGFLPRYKIVRA